jgi:hypothetical protein
LINNRLSFLRALNSLRLKRLNGLDLPVYIIRGWLESLELLLDLVHNGRVLQLATVCGEVDGLRQIGELLDLAAGIVVALLEGDESVGCVSAEA